MRTLARLIAAVTLLVATDAAAETPPSAWDRAKRPEVRDEYELHLTVQRILIANDSEIGPIRMMAQPQLQHALAMLQAADAEKSGNPLLRFDLGFVYQELGNHAHAATVWKAAMHDFPQHPVTRRTKMDLAIACAKMADHECEAAIYREVLTFESEPWRRTQPLGNLAESDMHNHDLKEAIAEYREVIVDCGRYEAGASTPALAYWGLAVALDRAGEVREAQETAAKALQTAGPSGRRIIDFANTKASPAFFVPGYEVAWYQGLTSAAQAQAATTSYDQLTHWQNAEKHMRTWVTGAEVAKDYWLPIAKARLAAYEAERKKAEAKVAREAPRVVPGRTIIDL